MWVKIRKLDEDNVLDFDQRWDLKGEFRNAVSYHLKPHQIVWNRSIRQELVKERPPERETLRRVYPLGLWIAHLRKLASSARHAEER